MAHRRPGRPHRTQSLSHAATPRPAPGASPEVESSRRRLPPHRVGRASEVHVWTTWETPTRPLPGRRSGRGGAPRWILTPECTDGCKRCSGELYDHNAECHPKGRKCVEPAAAQPMLGPLPSPPPPEASEAAGADGAGDMQIVALAQEHHSTRAAMPRVEPSWHAMEGRRA